MVYDIGPMNIKVKGASFFLSAYNMISYCLFSLSAFIWKRLEAEIIECFLLE